MLCTTSRRGLKEHKKALMNLVLLLKNNGTPARIKKNYFLSFSAAGSFCTFYFLLALLGHFLLFLVFFGAVGLFLCLVLVCTNWGEKYPL